MRRAASSALAKQRKDNVLPTAGLDESMLEFSDKQVAELTLQDYNKMKRKIAALKVGHLPASEIDDGLLAQCATFNKKLDTNFRNRRAEHKRKLKHVIKKSIILRGLRWWPADTKIDTGAIRDLAGQHGLVRGASCSMADVLLSGNPTEVLPKIRLAACLTGAMICNADFVRSAGQSVIFPILPRLSKCIR